MRPKPSAAPKPLILIYAGNYAQARNYIDTRGDTRNNRYAVVEHLEHIMGLENFTFVRVGTWREREDSHDVMDCVRTRRGITMQDA